MSRALSIAREGVRHVVRHPLRSALSAATCAVAIAVTVNVISLVYGLDESIRGDVSRFGRTTIDVVRMPMVLPGQRRDPLGEAQVREVRAAMADLDAVVVPRRQATGTAVGTAEVRKIGLVAAPPEYRRTIDVEPVAGRWFLPSDPADASCVLDHSAAEALFPGLEPSAVVGREVLVRGATPEGPRRVLGVLDDPMTHRALFEEFDEGRGSRTLTSALLSFRNVYLPEGSLPGDELSAISVVLGSARATDEAAARLRVLWPPLESSVLPVASGSVGVFVRREWMDALGDTTSEGALLGNLVWIIIVGVAIVMISTLNLITIRERYDEIAVRRCEGARRGDVALQVTVEGTLTALAGGIVGLPIGYVGAAVMRRVVDIPFGFELRHAAAATLVAVGLGLVASVVPARRAARLQPARILSRRLT